MYDQGHQVMQSLRNFIRLNTKRKCAPPIDQRYLSKAFQIESIKIPCSYLFISLAERVVKGRSCHIVVSNPN